MMIFVSTEQDYLTLVSRRHFLWLHCFLRRWQACLLEFQPAALRTLLLEQPDAAWSVRLQRTDPEGPEKLHSRLHRRPYRTGVRILSQLWPQVIIDSGMHINKPNVEILLCWFVHKSYEFTKLKLECTSKTYKNTRNWAFGVRVITHAVKTLQN